MLFFLSFWSLYVYNVKSDSTESLQYILSSLSVEPQRASKVRVAPEHIVTVGSALVSSTSGSRSVLLYRIGSPHGFIQIKAWKLSLVH